MAIVACCFGKTESAFGFKWQFTHADGAVNMSPAVVFPHLLVPTLGGLGMSSLSSSRGYGSSEPMLSVSELLKHQNKRALADRTGRPVMCVSLVSSCRTIGSDRQAGFVH